MRTPFFPLHPVRGVAFKNNLFALFATFLFLAAAVNGHAQINCGNISFQFVNFEPCRYRLTYDNSTECFSEMNLLLDPGTFANWSANTADGFTVTQVSPSQLHITHEFGFIPLGFHAPVIFTLPVGLVSTIYVGYLDVCGAVGCDYSTPIESCPDPQNASIIGVKYRECNSSPYSNQATIAGWPITLINEQGVEVSTETDLTGNYAFYDLPLGQYLVKEAVRPGWTANIPASGQTAINLNPSQQSTQNFGNCPTCTCDSIDLIVNQYYGGSDTSNYSLTAITDGGYCYQNIRVVVEQGQLINWSVTLPGWTVTQINAKTIQINPPGQYLPMGGYIPVTFHVAGPGSHSIVASAAIGSGPNAIQCSHNFAFINPPVSIVQQCCPASSIPGTELVVNGDFNVTNPANSQFGFITSYSYIIPPPGGMSPGSISIVDQLQAYNSNNQWFCGGINGASDTYLAVDGHTMAGKAAWKEQVAVTPGTQYSFCAYVNNLVRHGQNFPDPIVELWITDGANPPAMVAQLPLPENPDVWVQINGSITPVSSSVILEIRSSALVALGNDFAVDKVSFRSCTPINNSCCQDYDIFCQNLLNAVTVSVNNNQCKATVNVGNLPACDYLQWVDFGVNGGQVGGPFTAGAMPMHTYSGSGTYIISYLAIETNPATGLICFEKVVRDTITLNCDTCTCNPNATITITSGAATFTQNCGMHGFLPVLQCPTAPLMVSSNFGCVNANGASCGTNTVGWHLEHPLGTTVTAGSIPPNTGFSIANSFYSNPGAYYLFLDTYCPGSNDTCRCQAQWVVESCDTICKCDSTSFDLSIRVGGAPNFPVHCGDTINTGHFTLYSSFNCNGSNCAIDSVHWTITGPNGFATQHGAALPTPAFTVPFFSPFNVATPGMYMLQMYGICDGDTCRCKLTVCVQPPPPVVNDTAICRTLSYAYIPLYDCPTGCGITQVQWFVKPCSSTTWPTVPYQISQPGGALNCSDLLLLPYKYPNETCLQVYAVLTLDGRCCVTQLTSNIATITLCNPITCTINNSNTVGYCGSVPPSQLSVSLTGVNCNYTVEWFYQNQLVSTSLTYQPPVLTYLGAPGDCYYDHVFTVKITGVCGVSNCTTSIRVFNPAASIGAITMNPLEAPPPFCPGEDFTLEFKDKCAGIPPKWKWNTSTTSATGPWTLQSQFGDMNPVINTNQLFQTTWYMVEAKNGACPPKQEVFKIDIRPALQLGAFTAQADPCADTYVNLSVSFTPATAPVTGCPYVVDWYKDGNLIGTANPATSPATYTYFGTGGSVAGVYYAVVRDVCCDQNLQTGVVVIDPTCVPVITGPCFICGFGPITLNGVMVLPPKDPCPTTTGCTYQWYEIISGSWVPITGANGGSITINHGGDFVFQSNCNGCIRSVVHHVEQCGGTDCIVGVDETKLSPAFDVSIFPNPTTGAFTLKIAPEPLRDGRIDVVRLDGQLLLSETMTANQTDHLIALDHLPPGLYFVRVYDGKSLLWTGKIVKAD